MTRPIDRRLTGPRMERGRARLFRSAIRGTAIGLWLGSIAALDAAAPAKERQGGWIDLGAGVLKDKRTGLGWTKSDNGRDIDWNDAGSFCAAKSGGWRLPTIEELAAIYDEGAAAPNLARCANASCRVSPLFQLSGPWFWSATPLGNEVKDGDELAWGVLLVNGARTQALRFFSYGARALCVRGP
jgi:hypothetical protein